MASRTRQEWERKKLKDSMTPWQWRLYRKAQKVKNREQYLKVKAKKDPARLAEAAAQLKIEQDRIAQASAEWEERKQARLTELRAGAEATFDDQLIWDDKLKMEKNTPEWHAARAPELERIRIEHVQQAIDERLQWEANWTWRREQVTQEELDEVQEIEHRKLKIDRAMTEELDAFDALDEFEQRLVWRKDERAREAKRKREARAAERVAEQALSKYIAKSAES